MVHELGFVCYTSNQGLSPGLVQRCGDGVGLKPVTGYIDYNCDMDFTSVCLPRVASRQVSDRFRIFMIE